MGNENEALAPVERFIDDPTQTFPHVRPKVRYVSIRQRPVLAEDGQTVLQRAGGFRSSSDEVEDTTELLCIILAARPTRAYWAKDADRTGPPTCASENGVRSLTGDLCAECPMQRSCKSSLLLLCLDDELDPFVFRVTAGGIGSANKFLSGAIYGNAGDQRGGYLWDHVVKVRTQLVKSKKFDPYYVPQFDLLDKLPDDMIANVRGQRLSLVPQFMKYQPPQASPRGVSEPQTAEVLDADPADDTSASRPGVMVGSPSGRGIMDISDEAVDDAEGDI